MQVKHTSISLCTGGTGREEKWAWQLTPHTCAGCHKGPGAGLEGRVWGVMEGRVAAVPDVKIFPTGSRLAVTDDPREELLLALLLIGYESPENMAAETGGG